MLINIDCFSLDSVLEMDPSWLEEEEDGACTDEHCDDGGHGHGHGHGHGRGHDEAAGTAEAADDAGGVAAPKKKKKHMHDGRISSISFKFEGTGKSTYVNN